MSPHARKTLVRGLGTVIALVGLSVVSGVPAALAGLDLKIHDFAAGAVAAYNRCTPQPNGDDLCEDFNVIFLSPRGAGDNVVYVEHFEAFIHPDGTATEFVAEVGFETPVSGAYDGARLSAARMDGATVALNDVDPVTGDLVPNGRTVTLGRFEWIAASGVYVFGNDGPFGSVLPHLFIDRCVTQVNTDHDRFTTARVTGTINGVSVDAYGPSYLPWPGTGPADALGAVFDNRITIVVASHAPGC
jgi:hypothetical protein